MNDLARWPAWTREPIVHFLIIGGLLYALLTWGEEAVDPSSRVIDVDDAVLAELSLRFERTMGRAPTDTELDSQIDQFVRDEVLYREALRLGLDQGDAIVRRRMVTKMDLAASAAAESAEPDEATLKSFFDANQDRYRSDERVSFDQIFYGPNSADSWAALRQIDQGRNPSEMGLPTSLPLALDNVTLAEVSARFGEAFARSLADIEPSEDDWRANVQSGFGHHTVLLRARTGGDPLAFEDARSRVEGDWRSAEIANRKQRAFDILREAYQINIDR